MKCKILIKYTVIPLIATISLISVLSLKNDLFIGYDINSPLKADLGANLGILEPNLSELPPILQKIAFCESSNRHFDKNGKVLVGRVNQNDIGVFQINIVHKAKAAELGLNLYDEQDNIKYALYLFEKYKTRPWKYSARCWFDGKGI